MDGDGLAVAEGALGDKELTYRWKAITGLKAKEMIMGNIS